MTEKFTEIDGKAPIVVPEPKDSVLLFPDALFRQHTHGGRVWLVPKDDVEAVKVVFDGPKDLDVAYRHVKDWRVAVQAGGCIGTWPRALAGRFQTVYTFEPDPVNFACLSVNLADCLNVVKIQAALGHGGYATRLVGEPSNAGALCISYGGTYKENVGTVVILSLDTLVMPGGIGLVQLDVEGFEAIALQGMEGIIEAGSPVLMIEEKGLGARYGVADGEIGKHLAQFGYKEVDRINRDVIYAAG